MGTFDSIMKGILDATGSQWKSVIGILAVVASIAMEYFNIGTPEIRDYVFKGGAAVTGLGLLHRNLRTQNTVDSDSVNSQG